MGRRFGGPDARRRRKRLDGSRHPGGQPAAAAAHHHIVKDNPHGRRILGDFEPDRALTGNDVAIVIRWHDHRPGFCRKLCADGFTVLAVTVIGHHARAERAGVAEFHGRGIGRHDDGGRDAEHLRRQRNPLRMIARRPRHHALGPVSGGNLHQPVIGAAEFEGPDPLQHFRLDENAPARAFVERHIGEQRRAHRMALDARGGGPNIGERADVFRRHRHLSGSRISLCACR